MPALNLKSYCLLLITIVAFNTSQAQHKIKLNQIAKILFISNGPAASFFTPRKKIEIVLEDKLWKCYQTLAISEFGTKRDTQRRYVKDANKRDLQQLLKIINKADTTLRLKNFSIDKKLLVKYIDSASRMDTLPAAQRPAFVKFLNNNDSLKKALAMTLQKMGHSDYSYQYIFVITKANDTLKVNAMGDKIYYLPWHIGNKSSYDPQIDILFRQITQGLNTQTKDNRGLYRELCKCAYMLCFHKNRSLRFFYYVAPNIIPVNFSEFKINP